MKRAQIIVEYAIISAFAIVAAIMLVVAFNIKNLNSSTTFGIQKDDGTVVVPPMTQ